MNNYDKICLMVPTYHRINSLNKFIKSAIETCDNPKDIKFCFCIHIDDNETRDYINNIVHGDVVQSNIDYEIIDEKSKQPNLALYFNLMYDNTRFKDAVVTMLGDDMVFKTKGWDTRILKEINDADGKIIVYCNDDFVAQEKCAVNLFTTREMVALTKKPFMCTFFHADMIDVIWTAIGLTTGRIKYLSDVIIQHNHFSKSKKEDWDETAKRLSPLQRLSSSKDNMKLALAYAAVCSRNIIESGVGSWNILQ